MPFCNSVFVIINVISRLKNPSVVGGAVGQKTNVNKRLRVKVKQCKALSISMSCHVVNNKMDNFLQSLGGNFLPHPSLAASPHPCQVSAAALNCSMQT